MLDKELREKGPPDTFDNSMLKEYLKCPRSSYWTMRRLTYKRTPSYFVWGRAFGAGVSAYHASEGESLEMRLVKAKLAARTVWEGEDVEIFDNRPNDTWDNLSATLDLYAEVYGEKEPWRVISPEVGFRFPLSGTSIFYGGSLDEYVDCPGYGVMAREDKSTGSYLTPGYLAQWSYSSQVTGYTWALHQLVEKPFGILMNIASKRPRKDPIFRFHRQLEKRSEWKIAEFMRETVGIADLIRGEWDRWEWPKWGERDTYACAGGPGLSPCLFKNLCLQEMLPWELEEKYPFDEEFNWRDKDWAPWERKGGDSDG